MFHNLRRGGKVERGQDPELRGLGLGPGSATYWLI